MDMPTLGAFEPFAKTELETSIPARFEAKVRRYADRIALRSGDQHVSYRTLPRSVLDPGCSRYPLECILEDIDSDLIITD